MVVELLMEEELLLPKTDSDEYMIVVLQGPYALSEEGRV